MGFWDNFAIAQKKSDFSIMISDADWDSDWPSLVSRQTVTVKINFVQRTLVFHLRQTDKGVIQDVIFHVLNKDYKKIDHICITPGKKKDKYEYHFKDGEVVDHFCEFSYDDDSPAVHILTVKFQEVELKTPAADRRTSVILRDEEKQQLNG